MEQTIHNMSNLFAQLGKPSDEIAILKFIETYAPLAKDVQLHEASFWTSAQATFLYEAIRDDADWAEVADSLNAQLHAGH